jgi:hypothetical protein
MRRFAALGLVAVLAIAACGGSSATQTPGGGGNHTNPGGGNPTQNGGGDWNGTGSAKVTVGGSTITVSPGGCVDGGSEGVDFRFGDFTAQKNDWIIGLVYHDGHKPSGVSGQVGGKLFVLDTDRSGTISGDGTGTFAGTDTIGGNGAMSATFSCS